MEPESTPQMSDYLATLKRRGRLITAVALPVAMIAFVLAVALPDVYRSTAAFQLRESSETLVQQEKNYADRYVSALTLDVLQGPNRRLFIKEINPYPDLTASEANMRVQDSVTVTMVTEKILDPTSGRERDINSGFRINYDHRNPQMAHKGAEWFANKFFEISRRDAAARMTEQARFYAAEAERTRARITEVEARLAEFKRENFDKLPATAQSNMSVRTQAEQEIAAIQREMNTLQQSRAFLSNQLAQMRSVNVGGQALYQLEDEYRRKKASYDENHPDMVALRRQIEGLKSGATSTAGMSLPAQLRLQRSILAQTRQRYSDAHPDVKSILREIESLEGRIARGERAPAEEPEVTDTPGAIQLRTQLQASDAQLASLRLRDAELRARIKDIDMRLASTPDVEKQFEALTRDAGSARDQYNQLVAKRMDAELQAAGMVAGTADKFRIVERPRIPEKPAKPHRIAIALFGIIGGLALAFIAVVIAEMLDGTVRSTRDVQSLLNATPLAVIPEIRSPDYRPWRTTEARVFAISLLAGVPLIYFLTRLLTH